MPWRENETGEILVAVRIIITPRALFRVTKRYTKGYINPPRLQNYEAHKIKKTSLTR